MLNKIVNAFLFILLFLPWDLAALPEVTRAIYFDADIQTNGKIVAGGMMEIRDTVCFLGARYNTDGTVDSSFATTGRINTLIGERSEAYAIAIQPSDQYILLAGYAFEDDLNKIALARYDTTGALDTTFGLSMTGTVTTQIGSGAQANGMAIQADGKIVVAGNAVISGQSQIAVLRYNTDGTLDTSFGGDGIVTTPVGLSAYAMNLALQSDGKIVVTGQSEQYLLVMRYTSAGALDTSFNTVGYKTESIDEYSLGRGIQIDGSGNLFVGGKSKEHHDEHGIIVEYDSTGSLVGSFGTSGIVKTTFGTDTHCHDLRFTSTGDKIILVGHTDGNSFAAQYNVSDGSIDTGFGTNGLTEIITTEESIFEKPVIESDDKIVCVGANNSHEYVVRLSSTGSAENTFDLLIGPGAIINSYDTTPSQSVTTSGWTDITFINDKELEGWSHTSGTATFTCNVSAKYQITYILFLEKTTGGTVTVSARLNLDGTEIAGSQGAVHLPGTADLPATVSSVTIETISSGQVLKLQSSASDTGVQIAPNGVGDAPVSAVLVVQRAAD